MNTYVIMMAIVLGLALVMKGNKKGSTAYVFVAVLVMLCVMGLREATLIGDDSASSYLHAYQDITDMSWSEVRAEYSGYNAVFYYMMKLVSVLSHGSYQSFVIIISTFIMLCFGRFVGKYSVCPVQSFCYYWGLLLYIFMFSAEKQAIAMSILLLAFDAIVDERPWKFVITVLIAGMFHFPALIFLPAYWLAKIRVERNFVGWLVVALLLTYIFRDTILRLMLMSYGGDALEATLNGEALLRTKSLIMIGIVVAAVILRIPQEDDRLYSILMKFMGIAIVFQTFCAYNNIFERLADYYFQFAVIFIPLVFEKSEDVVCRIDDAAANIIKTAAPVLFGAYGVYRFASYLTVNAEMFLPYVFCFEK